MLNVCLSFNPLVPATTLQLGCMEPSCARLTPGAGTRFSCIYPTDVKEEMKLKSLMQWIKSLFIVSKTHFGAADWQSFTFPFLKYMNKMSEPQRLVCERARLVWDVFCCFWTKQSGTSTQDPKAKKYMWHINFPRTRLETHQEKQLGVYSVLRVYYHIIRMSNVLWLSCWFLRRKLKVIITRRTVSQCVHFPYCAFYSRLKEKDEFVNLKKWYEESFNVNLTECCRELELTRPWEHMFQ